MLPATLLRASAHLEGERITPHYFTVQDQPWLRVLISEYARFVGRKQTELHERLREPLAVRTPRAKLRIAMLVLDARCRARPSAAVPPKEARAALFRKAAQSPAPRAAVLHSVAASFGVSADELDSALFADLHSERRVAELSADLCPSQVASDANLAIVSSFIRRAVHVRIAVRGNARALLRQARVAGLICRASRLEHAVDGVVLDVSGPFALFHHGQIYGRALASLIPRLFSCEQFELTASCSLGSNGHLPSLVVRSGDPIAAAAHSLPPERRIERTFERDFRRAAPDWELTREPSAIAAGQSLIFPDFEIVSREDPSRRWWLEIVGFWSQKYLSEKLASLRAANIDNLVLCIDQNRHCTEDDLPSHARVIRYKTRIDPRAVLAIITASRAP